MALLILGTSLLFSEQVSPTKSPRQSSMILTNQYNGLENARGFSCDDTVYGYIQFPEAIVGEHLLEAMWVSADGTVKSHSRDRLNFSAPGRRTAAIWFKFGERSSGLLGNILADGMDGQTVGGAWQVHVRLDGVPVVHSKFNVHCS